MMKCAVVYHPDCTRHNMGSSHPESPTRFIKPFIKLKDSELALNLDFYEATTVPTAALIKVHSQEYLQDLRDELPSKNISKIDEDTKLSKNSLVSAGFAAGAQVNAVDLIMRGKAQRVYCHVRPPGHHAEFDKAMGFCFYNNLAIGVEHAIQTYGLKVAILDFDAHRGNGTERHFKNNDHALVCSSYEKGIYPNDKHEKANNIVYTPLMPDSSGKTFKDVVKAKWLPAITQFKPDLIYLSTGFDAHSQDAISSLQLTDQDYTWIIATVSSLANELCHGRIISTLEGGYNIGVLNRCIPAHVRGLHEGMSPAKVAEPIHWSNGVHLPRAVSQYRLDKITPTTFVSDNQKFKT